MAYSYEGRYALAEPGNGITALCINGDVNLFGGKTILNTTVRERYPDIQDEPKKLKLTNEGQWLKNLAIGLAVTAALAACAVAVVCTGGAALAVAALAGAAVGTGAVTAAVSWADKKSGQARDTIEFGKELFIGGGIGAAAGAGLYYLWPAISAMGSTIVSATSQAAGLQAGMWFGTSNFTACVVPKIVTAASYGLFATDALIVGNDVTDCITGENLIADAVFGGNMEEYGDFSIAANILTQCVVVCGSENISLAKQTQKNISDKEIHDSIVEEQNQGNGANEGVYLNQSIESDNVSTSKTIKDVDAPVLPEGSQWERNVLNSFKGGESNPVTYEGGTTLYRVGGKNGGFWSLDSPPATEYQWRVDTAIKQEFCNDASTLYKMTIPEGASLSGIEGKVGSQGMGLYGGAHQVYIDYRAVPSDWIEISPMKWK